MHVIITPVKKITSKLGHILLGCSDSGYFERAYNCLVNSTDSDTQVVMLHLPVKVPQLFLNLVD